MSNEKKMNVCKVTLSTGKICYLREMQISDTELAAQKCAARSNGDSNVLQVLMQKALLQLVLVGVDDKKLSLSDKEDMNSLLKMSEYMQLMKVIGKMSGAEEAGNEPTLEMVTSP